ncbi:hypothetical protein GWI33_021017 [Rhynchophorus ferrugineus]|uniref:Uncharacterized protein n=1 Tax=Rhynchophorus ferrugineus TaxID=354439 RepID=A0A834HQF1_RHYFE|nr:hypothetical protein GWI33_021017 [Rhynchophorus ferrugineus]
MLPSAFDFSLKNHLHGIALAPFAVSFLWELESDSGSPKPVTELENKKYYDENQMCAYSVLVTLQRLRWLKRRTDRGLLFGDITVRFLFLARVNLVSDPSLLSLEENGHETGQHLSVSLEDCP